MVSGRKKWKEQELVVYLNSHFALERNSGGQYFQKRATPKLQTTIWKLLTRTLICQTAHGGVCSTKLLVVSSHSEERTHLELTCFVSYMWKQLPEKT